MIEEGLGAPCSTSAVELLPEGGTHGNRGICLVKFHTISRHLVDIRRGAIDAAVATDAVSVDIVSKQENKVWLGRPGETGDEERCDNDWNDPVMLHLIGWLVQVLPPGNLPGAISKSQPSLFRSIPYFLKGSGMENQLTVCLLKFQGGPHRQAMFPIVPGCLKETGDGDFPALPDKDTP